MAQKETSLNPPDPPDPPIPSEQWDDEWDYTQGLIENSFMSKSGIGLTEMTDKGEKISTTSTSSVKLMNNKMDNVDYGKMEIVIIPIEICETKKGFSMVMSNKRNGVQIRLNSNSTYTSDGNFLNGEKKKYSEICPAELNVEYKITAIFNEQGVNKISINGVSMESRENSTDYCNFIGINQQNKCETILKSVKYKYNNI